jgi:tRNA threonylcarbamoyl adenosine modification protein YeaZ
MTGSAGRPRDGRRRAILVLDTATSSIIAALAAPDGTLEGLTTWPAGHRHGETLLPAIGRLLGEANVRRSRIAAVVVGTGPGAFTGLRVGIATAKAAARALGVPIVGVPTSEALLAALASAEQVAPDRVVLALPAGPADRIVCRVGELPRLLVAGSEPELGPRDVLCAVDLDGRAPDDAVERGRRAQAGLAAALASIGAGRLRAGAVDDAATLVPEYVTLPRGVQQLSGEVAWSRALP